MLLRSRNTGGEQRAKARMRASTLVQAQGGMEQPTHELHSSRRRDGAVSSSGGTWRPKTTAASLTIGIVAHTRLATQRKDMARFEGEPARTRDALCRCSGMVET